MRINRSEMMLEISKMVGQRGTCPRARVGCVIERHGRILAIGYNGSPPGEDHCDDVGCMVVDNHCIRTTHAEANAICWAAKEGIGLDGSTLWVTGWHSGSCYPCVKLAISAGINAIYTEDELNRGHSTGGHIWAIFREKLELLKARAE